MKKLYKKILETFELEENKSKFIDKNITPPLYIDLYAAQEQFEENFELFTQNALLVEWDIDHTGDTPIATLTFYCCFEQLRDTSNISLNRELGLKFLDYVEQIDELVCEIESERTGKMELVKEGFHKMDSIVDVYLLTYECSYSKLKNPQDKYQEGEIDKATIGTNLVQNMSIDFDD